MYLVNTWILRSITWRLKGGGLTIAPPLLSRTYQAPPRTHSRARARPRCARAAAHLRPSAVALTGAPLRR